MANDAGGRNSSTYAAVALLSSLSPRTKSELSSAAQSMSAALEAKMAPKQIAEPLTMDLVEETPFMERGVTTPKPRPRPVTRVVTVAPTPTKEDVISLIDGIKHGIVLPKERDMRDSFFMHSAYYIVLIAAGILVNISPTAATAIGTFGLGSLGVGANYNNLQKAVDNYINDRRKLIDSITELELMEGPKKDFLGPGGFQAAFEAARQVLAALIPNPASTTTA